MINSLGLAKKPSRSSSILPMTATGRAAFDKVKDGSALAQPARDAACNKDGFPSVRTSTAFAPTVAGELVSHSHGILPS
jgi:hypothetical protein